DGIDLSDQIVARLLRLFHRPSQGIDVVGIDHGVIDVEDKADYGQSPPEGFADLRQLGDHHHLAGFVRELEGRGGYGDRGNFPSAREGGFGGGGGEIGGGDLLPNPADADGRETQRAGGDDRDARERRIDPR